MVKTHLIFITIIFMLIMGCAVYGPLQEYPPIINSDDASIINVKRCDECGPGGTDSPFLTIDGKKVYNLKRGEVITFKINSGEHFFGTMGRNPWTFNLQHNEILIDCQPKKEYNLLIKQYFNISATIERVSLFEPKIERTKHTVFGETLN